MATFLDKKSIESRSQELPVHFRLNGAIYICDKNKFIDEGSLFLREKIYAYEMDNKVSIDIDSMIDFQFASFLMNQYLLTLS